MKLEPAKLPHNILQRKPGFLSQEVRPKIGMATISLRLVDCIFVDFYKVKKQC